MQVLIAIPVFNEEQYVESVLSQVRRLTNDVLVVDDGSTDDTPRILGGIHSIAMIRHERNLGYGQSLIDAFEYAVSRTYDWIITLDCDDQHEPARVPKFIERASEDDADIVSGSRYLVEHPGDSVPPRDRQRINLEITRMLGETLDLDLTDAFCGFKAYRVSSLAKLSLTERGYAFPLQFWVQAARHGLRVCELPVRLIYNDPTRHFGGNLDNPDDRFRHYVEVFQRELETYQVPATPSSCCISDPCLEP